MSKMINFGAVSCKCCFWPVSAMNIWATPACWKVAVLLLGLSMTYLWALCTLASASVNKRNTNHPPGEKEAKEIPVRHLLCHLRVCIHDMIYNI